METNPSTGMINGGRLTAPSFHFWKIALPVLATALVLTTTFIASIPGLHGDEAWIVLRVLRIANGERPFSGLTFYTGALNAYLAWPFLAATGYRFWALRMTSALFNVIAALFALDIVRTLHSDDPTIWRWTGALWVTSVPFVLYSRFAVEMSMLTPALLLGAIWLLTIALRSESETRLWGTGLGSGFMLGVAVYNHLVAMAIVAALGLGALAGFGTALIRRRITWLVAAGLLVGLTPTLINFVETARQSAEATSYPNGPPSISDKVSTTLAAMIDYFPSLQGPMRDLPALPGEMAGIIDGGMMFQRFTGERLVPVIPYFSVALLGLGAACLWCTRHRPFSRIDRAMLVAWLTMPIAIVVIAPKMALGYFEFPALVAPYALVRFAFPSTLAKDAGFLYRRIGRVALLAVLTLQIGYVAVDYFWAFARSGGQPSRFKLGSRLTETSDDFMGTDRLYRQLVAAGVHEVIAPDLLGASLAVQDLPSHHLQWSSRNDRLFAAQFPQTRAGRVALLAYNDPSQGTEPEETLQTTQSLDLGNLRYMRAPGFDPNFIVFLCDRP